MNFGSIMNVGYEKVFLMQNDLNMSASEIISTYTYKIGLQGAQLRVVRVQPIPNRGDVLAGVRFSREGIGTATQRNRKRHAENEKKKRPQ